MKAQQKISPVMIGRPLNVPSRAIGTDHEAETRVMLTDQLMAFKEHVRQQAMELTKAYQALRTERQARERAEEAHRRSDEILQAVISASPLAVVALDADGNVTSWDAAAEQMFGWTAEEVCGRRNPVSSEAQTDELFLAPISNDHDGSLQRLEVQRERKDGTLVDVALSSATLRGQDGKINGTVVAYDDLTRRRELEQQLCQAQKMEAVGRLAGGVAHDFNNLLTVISGYTELLIAHTPDGDSSLSQLNEVRDAAERAAELTSQLLAFSRRQVLRPRVLDLNVVVAHIEKMLERLIGEDIDLVVRNTPGLGSVRFDLGQMEQVIVNLVVNARDAMPRGGEILIETRNVTLDKRFAAAQIELAPGPYVCVSVTDTGMGMDAETATHIFEPFFTTKDVGKGTGLGLATVYGIVKQSGGAIEVITEIDRGTTFNIYLPRVGMVAPVAAPQEAVQFPSGTETVLLVEDEANVRSLAAVTLKSCGYNVIEAGDGIEAAQIAEAYEGRIHLVVTDVVMPKLSGPELAERLTASRRDIRVLLMSGYAVDAIARRGVLVDDIAFLAKPFRAVDLARKVRETLETSAVSRVPR